MRLRKKDVSIPNGMEFYIVDGFHRYTTMRFNSQWDGILRYLGSDEFADVGFNSQWDGILRWRAITSEKKS